MTTFTDFTGEGFNAVWDARPAAPACDKPVEVTVVGRRCVYVNNHRIAGGKPYVSENLPSHDLKTTLGEVLDAFTVAEIEQALREKKARREYFSAYHAAKAKADASAAAAREGQDPKGLEAEPGRAARSEATGDAQTSPPSIKGGIGRGG